ncbi:glycoside hydrolase family 6 protein (plasmid) [Coraliomargarita sp. W4R53]
MSRKTPARGTRTVRRGRVFGVAIVIVVVALAAVAVTAVVSTLSKASPPSPGMSLLVAADTKAQTAAETETAHAAVAAATYLAAAPTAVWLTPESFPTDSVRELTSALLNEGRASDAAVTLVIYGLPERDCGQYSAGGLEPEEYALWTEQIGLALRDARARTTIVVLEPDSLAQATECGNVNSRVSQLRGAIDNLSGEGTWIYVDAGHSTWQPAAEMAQLIQRVGTEGVRGFATNVSNYNSLASEVAYSHELSELLGGVHAVIDTSRSGAGSNGEWCNPAGRLIGERGATFGDDVVDVNLWIKPPGESDGECNGGPAAGVWWPANAIDLTREVQE